MPIQRKTFENVESAKEWMLENQFGRRNLTDDQRAALAIVYQSLQADRNKRLRTRAANELEGGPDTSDSRQEACKKYRISETKLRKAKALSKVAPESLKEVRDGKLTLNAATKKACQEGALNARNKARLLSPPSNPLLAQVWDKLRRKRVLTPKKVYAVLIGADHTAS